MHYDYPLVKKNNASSNTIIKLDNQSIGDGSLTLIAGPCAIESEVQIHDIAKQVAKSGATILRGGAYKPRTSPYSFQGLGEQGLIWLQEAASTNNMACISEVMDPSLVNTVSNYVDILQIGSRNMQNYPLLEAIGKTNKPVLLKRGMSSTYQEWLLAAEHIMRHGNSQIILCERGIRTFETATRNTLDLNAIPYLRGETHLPIIIDPSHGTGLRALVPAMSRAAAAVQADGIMIEVHTDPDASLSDAKQAIDVATFDHIAQSVKKIAHLLTNETMKS